MITGWQEITSVTGLGESYIKKAMKLYGFPTATRSARQGKALMLAWDKGEVERWMTMNQEMVMAQKSLRQKFDHTWT